MVLERGKNALTSPDKIIDNFADQYANISRDFYKKIKPEKRRKRKSNNKSFTDIELKTAINNKRI